ncbi:TPA: hypothetical protein NJ322_005020 [Vibrio parahaemolyticus]|nr:hypothetical protein [Vibrio parahaemolyticus]HCG7105664.1 hypothetical protein [Vibrio parahaemolyticus]
MNREAIDYVKLAQEMQRAFEQANKEEKERHDAQHAALEPLIEYSPLIIEIAKEIQDKRERRKRIFEKVVGAVGVSVALAILGAVGKFIIEHVRFF